MKVIGILVFCLSLSLGPSLEAGTVAYWRFEDSAASEANPEDFGLELSPSIQFSDDVPSTRILDDGQNLANAYSYQNGTSEEGSRLAPSKLLDDVIGGGSFTIEGFLKLADGASKKKHLRIIGNSYYLGSPGGWAITVSEGKLGFNALQRLGTTESSSQAILTSVKSFSENAWHHFAVVGYRTPDVLVVRLFLDGEESEVEHPGNFYPASAGEEAIVPNEDPILISSKNIFLGALDEIRISDIALDPTEFLQAAP